MSIRSKKNSASLLLQTAVYSATVSATSTAVFDEAPENQTFPYITIGEMAVVDRGNKTNHADEHIETFHVWSRTKGFKETKTLMNKIIGRFSDTELTLAGYICKYMDVEQQTTYRDPDGLTRHGIVQIRFNLTQQ